MLAMCAAIRPRPRALSRVALLADADGGFAAPRRRTGLRSLIFGVSADDVDLSFPLILLCRHRTDACYLPAPPEPPRRPSRPHDHGAPMSDQKITDY